MSDEWTMIVPPGRMAEAEKLEPFLPENVREIAESPLADGALILVNDTQAERALAAPLPFSFAPDRIGLGFRPWAPPPVRSAPLALVTLGGLG